MILPLTLQQSPDSTPQYSSKTTHQVVSEKNEICSAPEDRIKRYQTVAAFSSFHAVRSIFEKKKKGKTAICWPLSFFPFVKPVESREKDNTPR